MLALASGPDFALANSLRVTVSGVKLPLGYLNREHLREIFFMRLANWPDGTPIHVFVLPDQHPQQVRFAKEVLGVYPYQLRSAWDRMTYSGTGGAPTVVDTEEDMRIHLQSTPGAIGYQED
jgi:hypothetical protein